MFTSEKHNSSKQTSLSARAHARGEGMFFQAKLTVNSPGDAYEQEADRVADQVMRMKEGDVPVVQRMPLTPIAPVQRKCTECEKEEKEPVQRKSMGPSTGGNTAPTVVDQVLASGGGQPLDAGARRVMEGRFGHDFGQVRIHTNEAAQESARAIQAKAYTSGNNIVFGPGMYNPQASTGLHLIAHELTHTIQQGASNKQHVQRAALHSGNILYEGTCQHLACNSSYACEDPNGVLCPTGTSHAGTTRRPLFTCDIRCENNRTCDDNGHWMAVPHNSFSYSGCGTDYVICANNNFTHAQVRDRSIGNYWEVSPGIIDSLGVARGTFSGAVYASETDPDFLTDQRCRAATTPAAPDAGTRQEPPAQP